ncbi:exopolysaccharide Pel transporter PelG [Exiguobacterium sp. MMG028]|uniref:exopolysaccharide Pel transporter PelG n=1 Tax=Exiguobacterium sp. MMG028 TaxID=3021979 RepID=UPI0022FE7993|nr:exopolysaccharide Pel transporter PelG [Exiguobacterium sp. MMG028]MDA5560827.1 exopolysaccharide Pel transporter PelG [Exiguobacterium sp. MMG028]
MAGVGFKLQQLFQEDYFSSRIKAYAFAGLVTSGPWLIVIVTIALMQWLTSYLLIATLEERTTSRIASSFPKSCLVCFMSAIEYFMGM